MDQLDLDTQAETAFQTFSALTADMRRTGYVPTIIGRTPAQLRLRAALVAVGLPVWPELGAAAKTKVTRR